MSFRNTIRVEKLQRKNKMMGAASNIGGHTLESLDKRDSDYMNYFFNLSENEKQKEILKQKESRAFTNKMNISGSYKANLLEFYKII